MENKFEVIIQVATAFLGILISLLLVIYRKKFLELQKKYFSKQKDFFGQKALESMQKRSDGYNTLLTVTIGLFIIILSVIQLIKIFIKY